MKEHVLAPSRYEFENWGAFHTAVVQYHCVTRSDAVNVADRIATLREFLSDAAAERLGRLVEPDARHETPHGWDEWVASATERLDAVDLTIASAKQSARLDAAVDEYKTKAQWRLKLLVALVGLASMLSGAVIGSHRYESLCFTLSLYCGFMWMLVLFCAVFFLDAVRKFHRLKALQQDSAC